MTNAILLHGYVDKSEYLNEDFPSASNSHWMPWTQKQLLINGIKADTPEVPVPYEMDWESWVREVERFDINEDTILVGHSMGGGFWVRYLHENPEIKVKQVVLVAPWLNIEHEIDSDFFDFDINKELCQQAEEIVIFNSDNDAPEVHTSVEILRAKLSDVKYIEFHNYGHFCFRDLKTDAFPELIREIV